MIAASPFPRLKIGRASDLLAPVETSMISVRTDDLEAFKGIARVRQDHITAPRRSRASMTAKACEIASFALAAREGLESGTAPETIVAHLETVAALVIAAIGDLKGADQ